MNDQTCVADFRSADEAKFTQAWTDITIVLDRSGSMTSLGTGVVEGINDFIKATIGDGLGDIRWTLVMFDDHDSASGAGEEFPLTAFGTNKKPVLRPDQFVPRGGTALVDALCISLQSAKSRIQLLPDAEKPTKVIFVVVTDGGENQSREYTSEKLLALTADLQANHGFVFVYLGANQDAFSVARGIGVQSTFGNVGLAAGHSNANPWVPTAGGLYQGLASGCVAMACICSGSIASGPVAMMNVAPKMSGAEMDSNWKVY